jgi:hypothetical protein
MNMRSLHIIHALFIGIFLSVITLPMDARNGDDHFRTFKKAMSAADDNDYETAISLYSDILAKGPNHIDALTQLGVCFVITNQSLDSALVLFNKAFTLIPEEDHVSPFGIELQLTIARTHNLNQEAQKAMTILKSLRDAVSDQDLKNQISDEIIQTRNAAVLLKNPVPLKITNLGDEVNSIYDDHSPLVSLTGDRMFFTSRRPVRRDPELPDGQFPEKVFFSERNGDEWDKPKPMREFFSRSDHQSILSLSPDGNQIFLFKNDRGSTNIYVSRHIEGEWQEPEKLPAPINSKYNETHASLSPDQSTLFFTSNRPGGYGALDVYMVKKDPYGKWGEVVNLGPNINSEKDEETPMLHPDGSTLYFASDGHASMGRFDIFFSQRNADSSWIAPVNMGHPINTPDDDFFFVPTLDKSKAYYASYRFAENAGRSDIYLVEFDSTYSGSLAVIEGTISESDQASGEHIRILVSRESDNRLIGDYRPNPSTGKYLLFLDAGEKYLIKEVSPDSVGKQRIIDVPGQMSYAQSNQVVMIQDARIAPPLQPNISVRNTPTQLLANYNQIINTASADTTYTIQILALKEYPKVGLWFFEGLNIETVKAFEGRDGFLRYVTGQFDTRYEAERYLTEIREKGHFPDAWIRPWELLNDISETKRLLSER